MHVRLPRSSFALVSVAGLVISGAAALAIAPAALADSTPTPSCDDDTCTVTYNYTGALQTFTVPNRVTAVRVTVNGASGGGDVGGQGGQTSATVPVAAADTLSILVGQQGSSQNKSRTYGGGGSTPQSAYGSSGGGGSFVFDTSGGLLVAAGGGGGNQGGQIRERFGGAGAGAASVSQDGIGGSGGYEATFAPTAATGGTQSAGGQGGRATWNGSAFDNGSDGSGPARDGIPGAGGDAVSTGNNVFFSGGGGGGGYFGGGGGSGAQGGGGGSGYAAPDATEVESAKGVNLGAGSVTIGWDIPKYATTTTLSASPVSGGAADGESVTLTATVATGTGTPTGAVSFTDGGSPLSGCSAVAVAVTGDATCTTSFESGAHSLGASYSGSATHAKSAGTLAYQVSTQPSITTDATLPAATVGVAYSQTLAGTGGTGGSYTYSFPAGVSRPSWLSLSSDGVLAGTPQQTADAGTFTVVINDGTRSTSTQFSVAVGKGARNLSFTLADSTPGVGNTTRVTMYTLDNTGTHGPDVQFSGNENCSVDEYTVTFDHAGTCRVTASIAADEDYNADSVYQDLIVGKGSQSILVTSNPPATAAVDDSHTLTVAGGASGADVSIGLSDSTTNSACTVGEVSSSFDDVSGRPTSSAPVSFDKVGSCVLTLTQGGNDDYTGAMTSFVTIQVTGKATSTSLSLSTGNAVHGEPVTATATVKGGAAGTVAFSVDGQQVATKTLGSESSTAETTLPVQSVGTHQVTASFTPTDTDHYAASTTTTATALTVTPSSTTTTVKVNASTLVATVTINAPSTDVPSGTVEFFVEGKSVGTATIVEGTATLDYTAPTGKTVAASYSGAASGEVVQTSSSSASTARTNPTVTATVASRKAKSKAGWYSAPVTISYRCTAGSGAVTCPKPVTVTRDGLTTVTRKVMADDGGIATVATTVKVDRTRPTVKVTGIRNGGTYPTLPKIGCAASDKTSGIASCVLTRTVGGSTTTTFVATATDRAGNTSRSTVTIRRSPVLITGADYRGSIPTVKRGKGYTLVYTGKGTPRYVNAAPSPRAPKGDGGAFTKIGKNRWAYSVVFTKSLKKHPVWNFGVKVGKRTITVSVRVVK